MSRDYRDKRGGHESGRYWISAAGHSEFARRCRRTARHAAKAALRRHEQPADRHPAEKEYFD